MRFHRRRLNKWTIHELTRSGTKAHETKVLVAATEKLQVAIRERAFLGSKSRHSIATSVRAWSKA